MFVTGWNYYSGRRGGSTTNQMITGPGFLRSSPLLEQLWVIMAFGPGGFVLNPWMHCAKTTRYVLGDGQRRWNERSTVYFAFHRLSVAPGALGLPKPLGICGHDKPCHCYLQPALNIEARSTTKKDQEKEIMTSSQENASVYVGFFYGQYIFVYIYMYIDIYNTYQSKNITWHACSMSCILL